MLNIGGCTELLFSVEAGAAEAVGPIVAATLNGDSPNIAVAAGDPIVVGKEAVVVPPGSGDESLALV